MADILLIGTGFRNQWSVDQHGAERSDVVDVPAADLEFEIRPQIRNHTDRTLPRTQLRRECSGKFARFVARVIFRFADNDTLRIELQHPKIVNRVLVRRNHRLGFYLCGRKVQHNLYETVFLLS